MELRLNDDRSEIVPYRDSRFPVLAREERLSYYPGSAMASHWHDDVELILVRSGSMQYWVDDRVYHLRSGEGLFVNARRLHSGRAADAQDCSFLCVVFPPALLSGSEQVRRTLLSPVTGERAAPSALLRQTVPWQRAVCEEVRRAVELAGTAQDGFELELLSCLLRLWLQLYRNLEQTEAADRTPPDGRLDMLHRMIGFIQKHYAERITLQDIAAAGSVSKSYCCAIFQALLRQPPMAYLCAYRLEKSAELLVGTALSVTEIASLCGFAGHSYFTELFHREMGCTPRQYRSRRA